MLHKMVTHHKRRHHESSRTLIIKTTMNGTTSWIYCDRTVSFVPEKPLAVYATACVVVRFCAAHLAIPPSEDVLPVVPWPRPNVPCNNTHARQKWLSGFFKMLARFTNHHCPSDRYNLSTYPNILGGIQSTAHYADRG